MRDPKPSWPPVDADVDPRGVRGPEPDALRAPAAPWAIHAHALLESTSDEAHRLARVGAPHGTVVWARAQSAGRGRLGRVWASPEGNLFLSVLLRIGRRSVPQLGFVAALAVADAVDRVCGASRARLKWPNDVTIDGGKMAGLLLEAEQAGDSAVVVLGIGVNLKYFPDDVGYAATSLLAHGTDVAVRAMLDQVLDCLAVRLCQWGDSGFERIRRDWLERGHRPGDVLAMLDRGQRVAAEFDDLDGDGALLARVDGVTRRFSAAEIVAELGHTREDSSPKNLGCGDRI